jgi:hypothetical protein
MQQQQIVRNNTTFSSLKKAADAIVSLYVRSALLCCMFIMGFIK